MAQVGDIGLVFTVTFMKGSSARDISAGTTLQIKAENPSGTLKTWTAAFVTDGTDGAIDYTTATAADLDEAGEWQVQGYVSGGGITLHSEPTKFHVFANLS